MNLEAFIAKAGGRTDCQPFQTRPWTCTACASWPRAALSYPMIACVCPNANALKSSPH